VADVEYDGKFKLDYVTGGGGLGVGGNQNFGTTAGLAGGISGIFSDILGNNKLFGTLQVNGQVEDFGGQFSYINEKSRVAYGASLSHIPYRFGSVRFLRDETTFPGQVVTRRELIISRLFEQQFGLFGQLPFSSKLRLELGGTLTRYGSAQELNQEFYTLAGGFIGRANRERLESPIDPFAIVKGYVALVGDNTVFGLASPIMGHRFRIESNINAGALDFAGVTVDARKYVYAKPFTIAGKLFHLGRYGSAFNENQINNFSISSAQDVLARSIYIGNQFLLRGFQYGNRPTSQSRDDLFDEQLFGSKVVAANFEVRIPFTGPKQIALFKSNFLFSELALFFDAGAAFNRWDDFDTTSDIEVLKFNETTMQNETVPLTIKNSRFLASTGIWSYDY